MTATKTDKTFGISYKHPEHGSDRLEINFKTVAAANAHIEDIYKDPVQLGYVKWLADSSLWVTDEDGNIY